MKEAFDAIATPCGGLRRDYSQEEAAEILDQLPTAENEKERWVVYLLWALAYPEKDGEPL